MGVEIDGNHDLALNSTANPRFQIKFTNGMIILMGKIKNYLFSFSFGLHNSFGTPFLFPFGKDYTGMLFLK